ncbi:MAG: dTDP-glucose 4,6-dehydratase, partial [Anaerolineaceae bacterium]|nr:dTDP-glucose 4,6-dehydratase [Anaerolineaceae bacterium]
MQRVMITGGAGFIGSNFVRYLLGEQPDVLIINLDALTYAGSLENLRDLPDPQRHTFVHGDICDRKLVDQIIHENQVQTIVHFAAESHVDRSILDPEPFIRTNIFGTYTLLEAARQAWIVDRILPQEQVRFHHISTDEVFGSLKPNEAAFSETTQYAPNSPYAASKASSDHLVRAYHHTFGLPVSITNCSNNYGPFQFPEKFIPLAITNLLEGKKVPLYGDGLNVRDWLFVEDHCRAIDVVLSKGTVGETYCVGGVTEDISNKEVIQKILTYFGKGEEHIELVKDRPGHDRRYAVNWTKIHNELGWKPQYDFDSWLEKTILWYKENEAWWKRIKTGDYQSYYQVQYGKGSV